MKTFDQSISVQELAAYQIKMLNEQILYAATHSEFYNSLYEGLSLPLESLDALNDVPTITADDIKRAGFAMSCLPQRDIHRIVTLKTSGTTGESKRIFFTKNDIQRTVDFFNIGMQYMCTSGDSVAVFMPGVTEDGIGDQLRRSLEGFGAKPYIYGAISDYHDAVSFLKSNSFHTLIGIPSQMRALALKYPEYRPVNVLLSADYVPLSLKNAISRIWHTDVFEHYGMTETCYGGAVDCPAHNGMHIRHDEIFLEILDKNHHPVPHGEYGEITITTLRREAMPIIRYRTGDYGRLIYDKCICGSVLPRLDHVCGRLVELENKVNIHALDEVILSFDSVSDYTAKLHSSTLNVFINGDNAYYPNISEKLKKLYLDIDIIISDGEMFKTTGTLKRRLIME